MDARSRPRRVVGWVIAGVLAIAVGWLVLVNLALWTGIVSRGVSGERERGTIVLEHGFAWCVWPTRVHLSDLDLRIDRYGWQLAIAARSAVVDLDLLALLSRRFSASHVALDGASVTFRNKRDELDAERFEASGPIAGFDAPVRAPERPQPAAPEDAWSLDLPHMEADLERLWIDGVRAEMRGHATTGLFTVSSRMYGVSPTRIQIHEGIVFAGDRLVSTSLAGRIVLMVAPYSHTEVEGKDELRQLTALAELRADLTGARALERWLPAKAPRMAGGAGPVRLDVSLWSGVVTDGHLEYRTPSVVLVQGDTRIRGALALDVEIEGATPRALATARLTKISARTKEGERPWMRAAKVNAEATIGGLDLASDRRRLLSASAAAPRIEVLDLGVLDRVGKSTTFRGGRGEASVHVAFAHGEGFSGDVEAWVRDADIAAAKGVRVRANGRMSAQMHADPEIERVLVHPFAARIDDVSLRSERGKSDGFWARVGAGRLRWDRKAGRLDVQVIGELDDLEPLLSQAKAKSSMANVLEDLEELGPKEPLEIRARATVGKDTIDVRLDRAERPTLHLRGRWRRVGDDTRAAIMLERLRIGLVKSGEDGWDPVPAVNEAWLREHERWVGQL